MKVIFVDEYDEVIERLETTVIPRVGETVFVNDDYFYVKEVIWNILFDSVRLVLSEEKMKEKKETTEAVKSGLDEAFAAQKDATQALKETKSLRNSMADIRQYLRSTRKTGL
jgi:hypothetical protein